MVTGRRYGTCLIFLIIVWAGFIKVMLSFIFSRFCSSGLPSFLLSHPFLSSYFLQLSRLKLLRYCFQFILGPFLYIMPFFFLKNTDIEMPNSFIPIVERVIFYDKAEWYNCLSVDTQIEFFSVKCLIYSVDRALKRLVFLIIE